MQSSPPSCARTWRGPSISPARWGRSRSSTRTASTRSITATRTSMASTETRAAQDGRRVDTRPRIGLLGIMQALYDDMLPGITERQAAYAREVGGSLAGVADVVVGDPVRDRPDAERVMRELEAQDLDGLLVVMLTYGP